VTTRSYGRRSVDTSNEDKVFYPESGLTKGDLLDYYERAWPRMRADLADRPLVMQRFPDGIGAEGFFQKQVGEYFPGWIETVRVARASDDPQELVVCNAKASLAYLVNQACITPHLWLSRMDRIDTPDQLVIDVDPPGRDFAPVRAAAQRCRELLDEVGLFAVVKTTGSRGVHVTVPLRRVEGFDEVRDVAHRLAGVLARRHPEALTVEQRKNKRRGRVYLDVARNAYAQTVVAPYAVRALPGAPIAAPIRWSELERPSLEAQSFRVENARARLGRADPWAGWRRRARTLRSARERLASIERRES